MNRCLNEMKNLKDEELVRLVRKSNDEAFVELYERYLNKIRAMTYSFQGLGFEIEDLIQEATLGFYSAIQVYDFKSSSFSTFCYICIRRMLISLVRKGLRKGEVPRSAVIRPEDDILNIPDLSNPEQDYIVKEEYYRLRENINSNLSDKERKILFLYIKGSNYNAIAKELGVSRKTVDNALQRVRKKLR